MTTLGWSVEIGLAFATIAIVTWGMGQTSGARRRAIMAFAATLPLAGALILLLPTNRDDVTGIAAGAVAQTYPRISADKKTGPTNKIAPLQPAPQGMRELPEIPAAYRGYWAKNDCGDQDKLLDVFVTNRELIFHSGSIQADRVLQISDDMVGIQGTSVSNGDRIRSGIRLQTADNGQTLRIPIPEKGAKTPSYRTCPGAGPDIIRAEVGENDGTVTK